MVSITMERNLLCRSPEFSAAGTLTTTEKPAIRFNPPLEGQELAVAKGLCWEGFWKLYKIAESMIETNKGFKETYIDLRKKGVYNVKT